MKAWYLDIPSDPDQGAFVVYAETRNKARAQADENDLMYDNWIQVHAKRFPAMDDKENVDQAHHILDLWRNHGWRWWDIEYPDQDEATDEEFLKWYEDNFK